MLFCLFDIWMTPILEKNVHRTNDITQDAGLVSDPNVYMLSCLSLIL